MGGVCSQHPPPNTWSWWAEGCPPIPSCCPGFPPRCHPLTGTSSLPPNYISHQKRSQFGCCLESVVMRLQQRTAPPAQQPEGGSETPTPTGAADPPSPSTTPR